MFQCKIMRGGGDFMDKTVQEIMTQDVISVSPQDTVIDAANIMKKLNVGVVPVVENNKPIGIITDRDIVVRNTAADENVRTSVTNIMSKNIVTVSPTTDVHEAARLMEQHQIRRLPVVDNGKLIGMISLGDLATEQILENEAGHALSGISSPSAPATYGGSSHSQVAHEHQGNTQI